MEKDYRMVLDEAYEAIDVAISKIKTAKHKAPGTEETTKLYGVWNDLETLARTVDRLRVQAVPR